MVTFINALKPLVNCAQIREFLAPVKSVVGAISLNRRNRGADRLAKLRGALKFGMGDYLFNLLAQRVKYVSKGWGGACCCVAVVGLSVASMFGCSRHRPIQIFASISLDTAQPGTVGVDFSIHNPSSLHEVVLEFYLPDELMERSLWNCEPAVSSVITKSEAHYDNTLTLHRTSFVLVVAANQSVRCSYETHVGAEIKTPDNPAAPPRYGVANASYFVSSLDYVLPHVNSKVPNQLSVEYSVEIHPGQYHLLQPSKIDGKADTNNQYATNVVAGHFSKSQVSEHGELLDLWTNAGPEPELRRFLERYLATTAPLFAAPAHQRSLVDVPTAETDGIYPLHSAGLVAMDLSPFTLERALRLEKTLIGSILRDEPGEKHFSNKEEVWLLDSLPEYYAIRDSSQMGLLDANRTFYDLHLLAELQPDLLPAPLAKFGDQTPIYRGYYADRKGVLALHELDLVLRSRGSSLDAVVEAFFRSRLRLSFLNTLRLSLGWKSASAFWRNYVDSPVFPHWRPKFELDPMTQKLPNDQPRAVRVLLTGSIDGYLELCGCKLIQAGGASRRFYYIEHSRVPDTLLFDLGNFLTVPSYRAPDNIERLESSVQINFMRRSRYSAIAAGPSELSQLKEFGTQFKQLAALTTANLPAGYGTRHVRIGGKIYSVLGWSDGPLSEGPADQQEYRNFAEASYLRDLVSFDVEAAVAKIRQEEGKSSGVILIGYVHPLTMEILIHKCPNITAIFTSYPGRDRNGKMFGQLGRTLVVFLGSLRYSVVNIDLVQHNDGIFEVTSFYQQDLDTTVPDDPGITHMLDQFYNSAAFGRAASNMDRSDLFHIPSSNDSSTERFVGSSKCQVCHTSEYEQWRSTPHAVAFRTLLRVRREHNPECVACHVTGFHTPTGYSFAHAASDLEGVGCEVCHGAGSLHSVDPRRNVLSETPPLNVCSNCHQPERSYFAGDPTGYWGRIVHNKQPVVQQQTPTTAIRSVN